MLWYTDKNDANSDLGICLSIQILNKLSHSHLSFFVHYFNYYFLQNQITTTTTTTTTIIITITIVIIVQSFSWAQVTGSKKNVFIKRIIHQVSDSLSILPHLTQRSIMNQMSKSDSQLSRFL